MNAGLASYVRHLADCLDLRDWDLSVTVGETTEEAMAECAAVYGQRRAVINFAENWTEWTPDVLRSTVVHELIHCHTAAVAHYVDQAVPRLVNAGAAKVFEAAFELEMEYAVDAIACAVAKTLPLWVRTT